MPYTVPNQKTIIVFKTDVKGRIFAQIDMYALEKAAQTLDAGAFKLWIYFVKNQDSFEFALSRQAVEEYFGIKKKQYDNAVATLIETGYLRHSGNNRYIFDDNPKVEEKAEAVVSKRNHESASQKDSFSKGDHLQYQKETTGGSEKKQEILYDNKEIVIENSLASQANPQTDTRETVDCPESLVSQYFAHRKYKIEDGIVVFTDGGAQSPKRIRVVPDPPTLEVITIDVPKRKGIRY